MSFVEDRWFVTIREADGTVRRERSPRYGQPMRYRARYTDPSGKERSKSFPDGKKREAGAYAKASHTDVTRGTWTDPAALRRTLRSYAEDTWFPAHAGRHTTEKRIRSQLDRHILPGLGDRTLGDLAAHPSVIQQWVKGLPLAASSAGVVLGVLSSILAAAEADSLISRNPCRGRAVTAPPAEKRKVIPWPAGWCAAMRAELPAQYRAMADCGQGLGLRLSETLGLSADDIDWLRGVVHVVRQVGRHSGASVFKPPKGGKTRDVPLPETVSFRLARHIAEFPPAEVTLPWVTPGARKVTVPLLFTADGKAVVATTFATTVWKPARGRAGIPQARENGFHAQRHYFASVLIASGRTDPRAVADAMGHEDPGLTLRVYGHLMPGSADRIRGAVDDALTDQPRTDSARKVSRRRSAPRRRAQ